MDSDNKNANMNRWKAAAIYKERRFRDAAIWELTKGNRKIKISNTTVIQKVIEFKGLIDTKEVASLDELETWVFGCRDWSNPYWNPDWKDGLQNVDLSGNAKQAV